jgi:hypothetical protein
MKQALKQLWMKHCGVYILSPSLLDSLQRICLTQSFICNICARDGGEICSIPTSFLDVLLWSSTKKHFHFFRCLFGKGWALCGTHKRMAS